MSQRTQRFWRANSVQPQYNVRKWEEEFEKQAAIRESLSNFYPKFGNDAATEAMRAAGVAHSGGSGTGRSGGKKPRAIRPVSRKGTKLWRHQI